MGGITFNAGSVKNLSFEYWRYLITMLCVCVCECECECVPFVDRVYQQSCWSLAWF